MERGGINIVHVLVQYTVCCMLVGINRPKVHVWTFCAKRKLHMEGSVCFCGSAAFDEP